MSDRLQKLEARVEALEKKLEKLRSLLPSQEMPEGVDLDWKTVKEDWNIYKLEDGTTLKIKIILKGVRRLNRYNPDGTPVYIVASQNIVSTPKVPKKLMKPPAKNIKPI